MVRLLKPNLSHPFEDMAARRNVLHGASSWEREERASQQREYAALLQEQIRQKNVRHDAERAHRALEQQAEREAMIVDRARDQAPLGQSIPSPARSPKRAASMPYQPPVSGASDAPGSPSQSVDVYGQQLNYNAPVADDAGRTNTQAFQFSSTMPPISMMGSAPASGSFAVSSIAAFVPGPPIFESLLRDANLSGASTAKFNDELAALNRLTSEVHGLSRQRRMRVQSYVKPSFLLRADTPAPPIASSYLHPAVQQADPEPNNYEEECEGEEDGRDESPADEQPESLPPSPSPSPSPRRPVSTMSIRQIDSERMSLIGPQELESKSSRLRSSIKPQPIDNAGEFGDDSELVPLVAASPPSPPLPAQRRLRAPLSPPKARVATPELALDDPALLQDTHSEMLHFEPFT